MIDFKHGTFLSGKGELHYYRGGHGAPLVFLPGGGLGAMANRSLLETLADRYDVLALDLPGFGLSSPPPAVWDLEDYARIVATLLKDLRIDDYFLVGISLGGGVALALARNNISIEKLAVIDAVGVTGKQHPWVFRYNFYIRKSLYDLFALRRRWPQMAREFLKNRRRNGGHWKRIVASLKKCLLEELPGLESISVPTLIMWAVRDELFPVESATVLKNKIAGSELTLVKGNHSWTFIRPSECSRLLVRWFG